MQDPTIRPKKMIDIEANCVRAVSTYMQVKADANDFIKCVQLFIYIYTLQLAKF